MGNPNPGCGEIFPSVIVTRVNIHGLMANSMTTSADIKTVITDLNGMAILRCGKLRKNKYQLGIANAAKNIVQRIHNNICDPSV